MDTEIQKAKNKWYCIVKGCDEKNKNSIEPKFQLFPFPRPETTKRVWVENVNLGEDFKPTKYTCVCGKHFADGRPTTENPYPDVDMGWSCPKRPRLELVRDDLTRPTVSMMVVQSRQSHAVKIEARRLLGLPEELTPEELAVKDMLKPAQRSSYSDYCSAVGCPNSSYVLKKMGSVCHSRLFPFPKNAQLAKEWATFAQLNFSYSIKRGQLCELHFENGEPTDESPIPTLYPEFELVKKKGSKLLELKTEEKQQREIDEKQQNGQEKQVNTVRFGRSRFIEKIFKDSQFCLDWTGLLPQALNDFYDNLKTTDNLLLKEDFAVDGNVKIITGSLGFILTLVKLKRASTNNDLASMLEIDEDCIWETFRKWILFLASRLKPSITWPKTTATDDDLKNQQSAIGQHLGHWKIVGVLDCLKFGSKKFSIVYNSYGTVIYVSSSLYDAQRSDSDVVESEFQQNINELLKNEEILLTSRHLNRKIEMLKVAPTAQTRNLIRQRYESRLKQFAFIMFNDDDDGNCDQDEPARIDILIVCCGIIGLMPPVLLDNCSSIGNDSNC